MIEIIKIFSAIFEGYNRLGRLGDQGVSPPPGSGIIVHYYFVFAIVK